MQSKISESKPLTNRNILIVEDDYFILRLYTKWLTTAGAVVSTANNGAQCLQMLDEKMVDIVLLDLGMPGLNGYETLVKLREKPALVNLPVIILTNTTIAVGSEMYENFKKVGVKEILQKYKTSLTEIISCISTYLSPDKSVTSN